MLAWLTDVAAGLTGREYFADSPSPSRRANPPLNAPLAWRRSRSAAPAPSRLSRMTRCPEGGAPEVRGCGPWQDSAAKTRRTAGTADEGSAREPDNVRRV